MVNVGMLVNRRMELKKQGKLEEELVRKRGGESKSQFLLMCIVTCNILGAFVW